MSSIFNVSSSSNSDYFSSFFGTTSSSSSTGMSSLLGDYYSIKSGTYLKVAKKYYSSEASSSSSTADEKQTKLTQNSAETATTSVAKLMSSSLYKKVESTDEDGNTTTDYDKDSILKNVKSFISDYNDVISNLSDESNKSVLRNGVRLTNQTKIYESALKQVGISIKSDNTLELDEEAFGEADMTDVKSLFTGSVSFGKNVQTKFAQIYSSATDAISANSSLYSSTATKNVSTGSMLDSLL